MIDGLEEAYVDWDGNLRPEQFPGYNVFSTQSIAAIARFRDYNFFVNNVLSSGFFAYDTLKLKGRNGVPGKTIYYTHADSAAAGGRAYRERKKAEAQVRAQKLNTIVSSGFLIRD
jgi:hypothetical protein